MSALYPPLLPYQGGILPLMPAQFNFSGRLFRLHIALNMTANAAEIKSVGPRSRAFCRHARNLPDPVRLYTEPIEILGAGAPTKQLLLTFEQPPPDGVLFRAVPPPVLLDSEFRN